VVELNIGEKNSPSADRSAEIEAFVTQGVNGGGEAALDAMLGDGVAGAVAVSILCRVDLLGHPAAAGGDAECYPCVTPRPFFRLLRFLIGR